ncbi:MAG: hydroxymethylglutaryl-CoA synthase [Candidatus Heimdallarchaeota archaeon]|nr:hydroxymethylglutaryl-CoA synthase [Candidatus Heimdallarchaeota archaeon]MCK4878362.1 hydroxymethylglutaryl-CoA synthase [Candidatus Heimdallarchaeota archaeon]
MCMSKVGIVSYGSYIPRYRIAIEEIAKIWNEDSDELISQLQVVSKTVPGPDEDVATMAVESARNAVNRWGGDTKDIGAIYVGSESRPYAVKPTATIVAAALDAEKSLTAADLEFACKAATAGMQMCFGLVKSKMIDYGLAIGSDNSQARPRDPLEYTAGAGSAAFLIGASNIIAELEGTYSVTSDTPDFWRREGAVYPTHGQRFTGQPAYFQHTIDASKCLMEKLGSKPSDYNHVTFHQPNTKFPLSVAKMLGFSNEQVEKSLICREIGNTYSAASILGLAHILNHSKPGDRIFMTSYGSGAGSDAFSFIVTEEIEKIQLYPYSTDYYLNRKEMIDYGTYARYKGVIR